MSISPWHRDDKPYTENKSCGCATRHTDTGNPYGTTKHSTYCEEHNPYKSEYDKELCKNKKLKEQIEKAKKEAEYVAAERKKDVEEAKKIQKLKLENEKLQKELLMFKNPL
jgi:predicted RNase H-like nuclease (RuvC/YqgF family)